MADALNLNNIVRLEILNTNVIIEDLDIDFEVNLTNEQSPNLARVTIWNLSDDTKTLLKNEGSGVRIFYSEGDERLRLIFEGVKQNKVNTKKKSKRGKAKTKDPRNFLTEADGGDVATIIELVESYNQYSNSFFTKSYATEVSSTRIVKDIAQTMGLGVQISSNVAPRPYPLGISFNEHCNSALNRMTDISGARSHISNGVIYISRINETKKSIVFTFDSSNIDTPEFRDNKELSFVTKLFTYVRPDNWVNISTKDINGSFRIVKISHMGSNYSPENTSEIIVRES